MRMEVTVRGAEWEGVGGVKFGLINVDFQDFNLFGANRLHFGSFYIFPYFLMEIFNYIPLFLEVERSCS